MPFDRASLSPEHAAAILERWLGRPVPPPRINRLTGGMVDSVLLLEFDADPGEAVIKVASDTGTFAREAKMLQWLAEHTEFPVPAVYAHEADGSTVPLSYLLMERLPGVNLGEAGLSDREREKIDKQLAFALLDLHAHERKTYGALFSDGEADRWIDIHRPRMEDMWQEVEGKVPAHTHAQVRRIIDVLDDLFDHQGRPTLVHGDIWAANIMVAPGPDGWRLTGFIDPGAQFADVELELSYLEVFRTVGPEFFKHYTRVRSLREGYEQRRRIYWLQTMLIHVWLFGDAHYVQRAERLAQEISETTGL